MDHRNQMQRDIQTIGQATHMENLKDALAHSQARANLLTATYHEHLAETSRTIDLHKSALAQAQVEIESLKEALRESRSAHDSLINSTSWRVTAPLRRISQLLKPKLRSS
jgi:hypothetical protein